jgi:hypothetical protein
MAFLQTASKTISDNAASAALERYFSPSAMSRLMLKSAKRASLVENLRSLRRLGKMRVRRSGTCLANGERSLEKWKTLDASR